MDFESLVGRINTVQDVLQAQAAHAINLALTARNWQVGFYIVEFEQNGEDRAKYGENLLNRLAKNINRKVLVREDCTSTGNFIWFIPKSGMRLGNTYRRIVLESQIRMVVQFGGCHPPNSYRLIIKKK